MTCHACSQTIPDDSVFCEHCGANQSTASATPTAPAAVAPVHQAATAAAQDLGTSVKSFWGALDLPSKIAFIGAILAFVGFFLSWIDIPSVAGGLESILGQMGGGGANPFAGGGGPMAASTSLSGFTLAKGWGVIYLYPVLAVVAFTLLYLAIQKHRSPARILNVSGWLVLIGSLIGPQCLLMLLFVPAIQKVVGIGFWMNALGFCAIAVGGIMNIRLLSRKLA